MNGLEYLDINITSDMQSLYQKNFWGIYICIYKYITTLGQSQEYQKAKVVVTTEECD